LKSNYLLETRGCFAERFAERLAERFAERLAERFADLLLVFFLFVAVCFAIPTFIL
jgi:hypothetical protein